MGFRYDQTWFGVGAKGGGMLGIVGAEAFEGAAFRIDNTPQHSLREINITSMRWGLGLGGGVGLCFFVAFNTGTLWEINDKKLERDWGVNFAIPGEKISANKAAVKIAKLVVDVASLDTFKRVKDLETLRTMLAAWYAVGDIANGYGNKNAVFTMDSPVPGTGVGAEVSAFITDGTFSVGTLRKLW